ncbi:hypothetical protein [Anaerotignum propionicum]|uniref:hypothetical protein n=2 Tax=Anaerotignum TaxID=2039240 RepID=UPI00210ADE55|nr:hypothetical protein [Anaerotignum propionicum]MCQ4937172.1 hypothetical protein [Anaerotignum propionicum]
MFMIICLSAVAIIILVMASWDGAFMKTKYNIAEDRYDIEKNIMSEGEFQLIRGGIASSSSHNMQPWKIKILDENTFLLYGDMDKTLPVIDPDNKQLLMSLGTFIGSVQETAKKKGLVLDVQYAPIDTSEKLNMIATFQIVGAEKNQIDAMTSATQGVKKEAPKLEKQKISDLMETTLKGYQIQWVKEEQKSLFQDYLLKGTKIEANNQKAMEELLHIFRFTKWSKNHYRYGLSLNTMSPPLRMFVEPLVGASQQWDSFGKNSITTFVQRLENEKAYMIISLENPKPSDYIRVGEALSVLGLHAEGFTIKPAVQLIEPLEGMNEICNEMKETLGIQGEVMLIIGFTERGTGYHDSVRHQVMDIIMK